MESNFTFHVPINVIKGGDSESPDMVLAGIASTGAKDRQGEMLIPEGFDYSYLKNHGYINWHHQLSKNPEAIIGEPTKVEIRKGQGLYIEAKLYPDSDMAKKAYDLAQVLTKNSSKRQLGWSIEGKVVERDPNNSARVTKSKITGCALTPMPINPQTFVNIIKGMADDGMAEEYPKEAVQSSGNGGATKLIEKSIDLDGQQVTIKKDEQGDILIKLNKSLNTTSGAPIMPESVEGGTKPKDGYPPKQTATEYIDTGKMSKSEAYEYLFVNNPEMTISEAKAIMNRVKKN